MFLQGFDEKKKNYLFVMVLSLFWRLGVGILMRIYGFMRWDKQLSKPRYWHHARDNCNMIVIKLQRWLANVASIQSGLESMNRIFAWRRNQFRLSLRDWNEALLESRSETRTSRFCSRSKKTSFKILLIFTTTIITKNPALAWTCSQ